MSKRIVAAAASAVLAAGIGGYALFLAAKPPVDTDRMSARDRPVWAEAMWPFPIDQ